MARYNGPKSKIARKFREPIFGPDKALEKKNYPPGMHGPNKRRGRNQNMLFSLLKNRKLNILMVYWRSNFQICLKKLLQNLEYLV